jgi:hypothetical protein
MVSYNTPSFLDKSDANSIRVQEIKLYEDLDGPLSACVGQTSHFKLQFESFIIALVFVIGVKVFHRFGEMVLKKRNNFIENNCWVFFCKKLCLLSENLLIFGQHILIVIQVNFDVF